MKTMKKLLALTLALALVLSLAITASATTITITGSAAGSQYAAFKLLNATDGGDGKFAYTLNAKYADVLKEVTGKDTEAEIIKYISDLKVTPEKDEVREFADRVYAKLDVNNADYKEQTSPFEVADGYYLIAETKTGDKQDTYSLVMLDTAGKDAVNIQSKESTPTLEKKVQEKNDSTGVTSEWQDGADYDIGDEILFQLKGTVSDRIESYESYYYEFHDDMCNGLTFGEIKSVTVDGKPLGSTDYKLTPDADGHGFSLIIWDLLAHGGKTGTVVYVQFTATLEGAAVVYGNDGNPNTAWLEYSNNPYEEGKGENRPDETGRTPEDTVVVFTYKLIADKVDDKGEALEGAGFTLYKFDNKSNTYLAVGKEITGMTTFTFEGLDEGKYKLVETTVPDGYNKADDVVFEILSNYPILSDYSKLTALTVKDGEGNVISEGTDAVFTTNIAEGSVNTEVINNSGFELPSTGGIGTTIFYVVGGLLTLAAVVLLVTKKKMSAAE